MATVTVFTAARMQEIEDTAITFAYLDGNDLILRRHNMATINVGSVRGPKGDKGDIGEVSEAELSAAISAAIAGLPRGEVAITGRYTILSVIPGEHTWLSVSVPVISGRRYAITGIVPYVYPHTGVGNCSLWVEISGIELNKVTTLFTTGTANSSMMVHSRYTAVSTGSLTFFLQVSCDVNTSFFADAARHGLLVVDEIGKLP